MGAQRKGKYCEKKKTIIALCGVPVFSFNNFSFRNIVFLINCNKHNCVEVGSPVVLDVNNSNSLKLSLLQPIIVLQVIPCPKDLE